MVSGNTLTDYQIKRNHGDIIIARLRYHVNIITSYYDNTGTRNLITSYHGNTGTRYLITSYHGNTGTRNLITSYHGNTGTRYQITFIII